MRRLVLLIVISISVLPLAAQTDRATLTGTVMDPSQSVVRDAKVTLHAVATGIDRVVSTNSAGGYAFSALPVGEYTVAIEAEGFEKEQIEPFKLEVGETRTLNAILRVGSVSSDVAVVAAPPPTLT